MFSFKLYFRMLGYLRPYVPLILLSIILSFFIVIAESLSLWFSGSLIQTLFMPGKITLVKPVLAVSTINEWLKYQTAMLIGRGNVIDSLKIVCILVFVFFLAKNIFSVIKVLIIANVNNSFIRDLRNNIYSNALILPVSYFDRNRSGRIISLVLNDITALNTALVGVLDKLFIEPIRLVVFIATLFILSTKLTIAVFAIYPILGYLINEVGKTVRRRSRRMYEQMEGLTSVLQETMSCIRAVKMFNMSGFEMEKFKKENDRLLRSNYRQAASMAISSPLSESLGVLVTVVLLWVVGRDVLSGRGLGAEDFVRFLAFLFMAFQPFKSLSVVYNTLQNGLAAAQRVFTLIDTKPEAIGKFQPEKAPKFEDEIRFSHVRFTYPECSEEVIKDVSFSVKKKQIVALVGSSGSGKSTILDLVPRFYEISSGSITIDGRNIMDCDLVGLRHLFGIVAQETVLFNDTVYNNIAYGMMDASESKVIEAARAANAWEFIERLPLGLKTIIGERGVMLSGGQRQRLSIARAILKNPAILILDEATSALDTESERLVQSAINTLMENRTALVVAHRLSTIAHSDLILVLENGQITEQGTHAGLLRRNGRYKYFYDIQFASKAVEQN
jgi:ATP-binding cassette, subfamily B, bacterial MsbA